MSVNYKTALESLNNTSADKQVLELLSATKGFFNHEFEQLSAKQLIGVGQQLGLSEASVRMALSRQTKAGKLVRNQGRYRIAKQQNPYSVPRFWLHSTKRLRAWQGDWLLVHSGQSKTDPTIQRRLLKCAELLGLQHIPHLGYIRPNNLDLLREEVLYHFTSIAPDIQWTSGYWVGLDNASVEQYRGLWDCKKWDDFYHEALDFILQEQGLLKTLGVKCILNRSFICGRMIIEQLSIDPWLPEPWVDNSVRQQLIEQTMKYYQMIVPSWLQCLQEEFA